MATNLLIPNIVVCAAFCNTIYNLNTFAHTLINLDIYINTDIHTHYVKAEFVAHE